MNAGPFIKGMSVGLTVGAITYAMTNVTSRQKKRMKKTANNAMRSFSSVIEGISYMMH